jgi:hypothetical protein
MRLTLLQESNKVFTEPVSFRQAKSGSKSELEGFVKTQKTAMAADLEVYTEAVLILHLHRCHCRCKDLPAGRDGIKKEDYGKF